MFVSLYPPGQRRMPMKTWPIHMVQLNVNTSDMPISVPRSMQCPVFRFMMEILEKGQPFDGRGIKDCPGLSGQ
eukprot:scaffold667246_cov88-Prasinocladus_malaysianus.AAC.1